MVLHSSFLSVKEKNKELGHTGKSSKELRGVYPYPRDMQPKYYINEVIMAYYLRTTGLKPHDCNAAVVL